MSIFNPRTENDDLDDQSLLVGCARKDQNCFAQLYRRHHSAMTRLAYRYLGSGESVEDAVHEAMLVVWQKADSFEGRSRVKTWMLGIVILKSRELKRKQSREIAESDLDYSVELTEDSVTFSPENRDIQRALASLSDEHRSCIELAYYAGLDHREIAEIMDCPVNTVKTRVHFAKKYLKRFLDDGTLSPNSTLSKSQGR